MTPILIAVMPYSVKGPHFFESIIPYNLYGIINLFFAKMQNLISNKDFIIPIFVIAITQLVLMLPPILNRKLPESYKEASKLNEESSFCCTY